MNRGVKKMNSGSFDWQKFESKVFSLFYGTSQDPLKRKKQFQIRQFLISSAGVIFGLFFIYYLNLFDPSYETLHSPGVTFLAIISWVGYWGYLAYPFWKHYLRYGDDSSYYAAIALTILSLASIGVILVAIGLIGFITGRWIFLAFFSCFVLYIARFTLSSRKQPNLMNPAMNFKSVLKAGEHPDGFSERPVTIDFPEIEFQKLVGYAMFLAKHEVIWEVEERVAQKDSGKKDAVKLFHAIDLPTILKRWFPNWKRPYIDLFPDGTSEIFLNADLYTFLGKPVSYHLLCEHIIETLTKSYNHYREGDKIKAIDVFRVREHE